MVFFEGNYPFYGVFCRCSLHYEKFQDGTVKCIEHEIPFKIPEGWEWSRFSSLTINRDSERKPISLKDRTDIEKTYDYYGASGAIDKVSGYLFDERLLLIGEDGANLITRSKPIAFFATGKYWVNNHAHCIDSTDKQYLDFICLYINSINLEKFITGAAQPKMNQDNMNSILVPFPPLNEQRSIVKFIVQMDAIIGIIRNNGNELAQLITDAKSQILDLAIRGKLVPQDPDDEPASVLLERIRAEKEELIKQGKIKRDKKESIIFKGDDNSYYETISENTICIDDTIPYDLPVGWSWCKLKSLSAPCDNSFVDGPFGSNLKTEHYTEKREVRIIQLNNIGEFVWRNNGIKYTTFKRAETLKRCISYPEDIVIAKMMPAGRTIIIPHIENIYVISSDCVRLQLSEQINNKYLMYMLNSPTINRNVSGDVHGIGRSRTSLSKLKELTIPLPPYAEQMRIVKSIETAFAYLDKISNAMS